MSSRSSISSEASADAAAQWQAARYTLFLRVHSAEKLQFSTSQSSYCKLYLGETPVTTTTISNVLIKDQSEMNHRTFVTKVTTSQSKLSAMWNEKFEIPVDKPKKQILSVRVKSHHQLYSPAIGACAIQLKQLRPNTTVDQQFPLFKGTTTVGLIRLQLMLRENGESLGSRDKIPLARPVSIDNDTEVVVVKKAVKPKDEIGLETRQQRDSIAALEQERRRLELEEEERRRREREREQQLALEKKRIEEKMEQLKREEEERLRLKQEAEERQRLEAEILAAEREQERLRRQWQQQEEELARMNNQDNQVSIDEETKPKRPKSKSSRRSTLSLTEMIDAVVQDALPSDSDDSSSEELDSDDERELIRQIAKLKLQMKKKKKAVKAKLQQQKEEKAPKVVYVYETEYADHDDDEYSRKKDKSKHAQSFNDDLYGRHSGSIVKKDKHSKSQGDVIDRDSNQIKAMVPGQIDKKAKHKSNGSNNNQRDSLSLGQMVGAAASVAALVHGIDDDGTVEDISKDAVGAIQNLAPIGRFLGRKIHEASAKVAQMNETESPSYYF